MSNQMPVEALEAAISLIARKLTRLSWSRDDCRLKGQEIYVNNLTAQINKWDEHYHALKALTLPSHHQHTGE